MADINGDLSAACTAEKELWVPERWTRVAAVRREEEEELAAHLRRERPVVIRDGSIVPVAGWEDLDALRRTMAKTEVFVKRSRRQRVSYFRKERNTGGHEFDAESFITELRVPFADFVALADGCRGAVTTATQAGGSSGSRAGVEGEDRARHSEEEQGGAVLYCQESFTGHPELELEFGSWDWAWVVKECRRHNWGLPETNVLFMGTEGATTPAHFDEQHNFLNQVRGRKLAVLFPPDDYTKMYPFPVTHPCDRCSMVDVRHPDLQHFPHFAQAHGHVAVLEPGDVLYIPYGWWHYCETLTHLGASITFWSQAGSGAPEAWAAVPRALGASELARVRRNLEKLLAEDVGPSNLGSEALRLLGLISRGEVEDQRLAALRKMLSMVLVPEEEHLDFLTSTFEGRFGLDYSIFV